MRLGSRGVPIATVLAIGALAAPGAHAIAIPTGAMIDHSGRAQQDRLSSQWMYRHLASTSPTVRPNPDEQAPASTPQVVRVHSNGQAPASPPAVAAADKAAIVRDRLADRVQSPLPTAAISGHNVASPPIRVVSTTQGSPGFQYDDAAVGAGVMVGLVLLGTAGTLVVRRREDLRHT
jgi:cytoskeletal protein RodZ